ncbi:MAG: hypothetical protein FWE82_02730 [Defluviitaleaceae bacterium]|nr:hypothetical protein [Defluviitaleaceae bacterium]
MKTTVVDPHKSSLGMEANIAVLVVFVAMAVVSWLPVVSWVAFAVPIVFFFIEKESEFVKFQAVQACLIGVIRVIFSLFFSILQWIVRPKNYYQSLNYLFGGGWGITMVISGISIIVGLAITGLIIYLVFMAYNYKKVELPGLGQIAMIIYEKLGNVKVQ